MVGAVPLSAPAHLRWLSNGRGALALDVLVGVVAAIAALVAHLTSPIATIDPRLLPPTALSAGLTVVGSLGLVLRRRRPVMGFLVVAGAAAGVSLTDHYVALLPLVLLVSLYGVAAGGSRIAGVVALASAIGSFVALALIGVPDLRLSDVVQSSALMVAAWAVGIAVRSGRTEQTERLHAAEQDARAAREEAARAAVEERLRIARELHDVVAHSMSMIAVQAGVGAHVIHSDPAAAQRSLEVIAETSRQALVQTRAMLGMLRHEEDQPPQSAVPRLDDVDALADRVRALGIAVELDRKMDAMPLDEPTSLAAYRVIQESLTNVVKHAGAQHVQITIDSQPDRLVITVSDDGRGGAQHTGGHGLNGLRERARLLGGSLAAGAKPGGGFEVSAEFPLTAAAGLPAGEDKR